ncbi:MAG: hypothetical protein ACI8XC_002741 [Gammaproteobacteria bacterium]|jgi:hypothetical protein
MFRVPLAFCMLAFLEILSTLNQGPIDFLSTDSIFICCRVDFLSGKPTPYRGPQILIETYLLLLFAIPMLLLYTRNAPSLDLVWGMIIVAVMAAELISMLGSWIETDFRAGAVRARQSFLPL